MPSQSALLKAATTPVSFYEQGMRKMRAQRTDPAVGRDRLGPFVASPGRAERVWVNSHLCSLAMKYFIYTVHRIVP
jgi:hypothetical protein